MRSTPEKYRLLNPRIRFIELVLVRANSISGFAATTAWLWRSAQLTQHNSSSIRSLWRTIKHTTRLYRLHWILSLSLSNTRLVNSPSIVARQQHSRPSSFTCRSYKPRRINLSVERTTHVLHPGSPSRRGNHADNKRKDALSFFLSFFSSLMTLRPDVVTHQLCGREWKVRGENFFLYIPTQF